MNSQLYEFQLRHICHNTGSESGQGGSGSNNGQAGSHSFPARKTKMNFNLKTH